MITLSRSSVRVTALCLIRFIKLILSTASKGEVDSDTSCKEIIRTLGLHAKDDLLVIERRQATNDAALKKVNNMNKDEVNLKRCMFLSPTCGFRFTEDVSSAALQKLKRDLSKFKEEFAAIRNARINEGSESYKKRKASFPQGSSSSKRPRSTIAPTSNKSNDSQAEHDLEKNIEYCEKSIAHIRERLENVPAQDYVELQDRKAELQREKRTFCALERAQVTLMQLKQTSFGY